MKPVKGTNPAEFTFKPEGDHTRVAWTMSGKYSFIPKAIGLFLNGDRIVSRQFENGLAQLNSVGETVKK